MLERLRNTLQLTTDELVNKVTWPTWDELQSSTIVTLIASIIISLVIYGMDSVLGLLFKYFYQIMK
jgi:preprotein translocase subunit SecE